MISFHNPKFHEKILKKYGRKIRKSYFSNLFFRQNGKSSSSVKRHISVRINLNFHNTLFWKNYLLSSPKEKQQGNPVIPFKLSYPDLKKPDLTHEKPTSCKLEPGSLEPENLTPQLINPELTTYNPTFLKLIKSELTTHNLTLLKLISPELTTHNLTIHKFINPESTTRNLTIHKLINPESTTHNPAPANPTYTNFTSLKLTFSGKNSRASISEKGNKIQNPWNCKNFFSSGNRPFFIYSNPPAVPVIISQKTHPDTDSPVQSPLTILAESGLSRKIHNEALRKLDELNLSGRNFLFGGDFPAIKAANRALIHVFNGLESLLASNKSTYTIGTYTINSPADIARDKKYPSRQASHRQASPRQNWLQNTFKLQTTLISGSKAMLEGRDTSYFPKIPVLLAYNGTATYPTEQPVVQVPVGTTARIFNNPVAREPNLTEEYTLNYSKVNATGIKGTYAHLNPTGQAPDYAKTCTFSYTLIHPAVRKPASKVTRETDNQANNYQANNYQANNYQANNYQANNYPTADHYTAHNQKGLKREQQYPVRITRLQVQLKQPAFLKPLTTTAYTLKHPENPLPGSKESFTPNKTAAPTSGRKETYSFNPPGNHTHPITSIYTPMHPVVRAFNYVETHTHSYPAAMAFNYTANYPFNYSAVRTHDLKAATINYPVIYNYTQRTAKHPLKLLNNYLSEKMTGLALSGLSLSFPRTGTSTPLPDTGFLEHFRTLYSPSGTNTTATPSHFITLIKPHNPVQASRLSSSIPFNSSVPLQSGKNHTPSGQKAVSGGLWKIKNMDTYLGIRKLKQISSGLILSARPKSLVETVCTGLLSSPTTQKISEGRKVISTGLLFRFKGLPSSGNTAKAHPYPWQGSTNFTFSRTAGFGASGKERSELMHAGGSIHKTGRQELVYGKAETLIEEVKQIKKVVFETKAVVADHFESHLPQAAGKSGQVTDVEHMSEKIMRMIERRMKIEVERRGIF